MKPLFDPKVDYELREKANKDKTSALAKSRREGKEEGIEEGEKRKAIEIAKSLLDILDLDMISLKTGLSLEELQNLK